MPPAPAAKKKTAYEPTIVTPLFRGSYVHLTTPHSLEPGKEGKYSITAVFPKKDPATAPFIKKVMAALATAALNGFGKPLTPAQCKDYPIQDGDKKGDVDDKENPYLAGSYFFKMANSYRPTCIDMNRQTIIDPEALYSGAWYYASFQPFFWNNSFGKGVSLSLCNVMKAKDDEKITSRPSAEDDFKDLLGAAPAGDAGGDLLGDLGGGAEADPLADL